MSYVAEAYAAIEIGLFPHGVGETVAHELGDGERQAGGSLSLFEEGRGLGDVPLVAHQDLGVVWCYG